MRSSLTVLMIHHKGLLLLCKVSLCLLIQVVKGVGNMVAVGPADDPPAVNAKPSARNSVIKKQKKA